MAPKTRKLVYLPDDDAMENNEGYCCTGCAGIDQNYNCVNHTKSQPSFVPNPVKKEEKPGGIFGDAPKPTLPPAVKVKEEKVKSNAF
ncbi:hypothetical protein M569_06987 [Genlisea aurea]|uniref:Uncharacterized protein n=1 Tax=Genlisea aurea TaxID=192259 RepID=S8DX09_9LAMI|nr:hypothetical protein M569_06987 [Genlisea aurea]